MVPPVARCQPGGAVGGSGANDGNTRGDAATAGSRSSPGTSSSGSITADEKEEVHTMSTLVSRVNGDPMIASLRMDRQDWSVASGELPVLATPATVTAAAAWVTANKAAVAGAAAFAGVFGAGVWVGVATAD